MININLSHDVMHIPRCIRMDHGGGCFIDVGIYGLAVVNMIFKGRPEKISACGVLLECGK